MQRAVVSPSAMAAPCRLQRLQPRAGPAFSAAHPQLTHSRQVRRAARGVARRVQVSAALYGSDVASPQDTYMTLGVSHCFEKGPEGKLVDRFVIEPITANSLECMTNGGKTSFVAVTGLTLGQALARDRSALPAEFAAAGFCEDFEARCESAARTWMRPHAVDTLLDIVPLGQVKLKSVFNFSIDQKRVLNYENVVNDDDNIKQDLSIDVYGRKKEDEEEEAAAAEAAAPAEQQEEEEEDEMDSLLGV